MEKIKPAGYGVCVKSRISIYDTCQRIKNSKESDTVLIEFDDLAVVFLHTITETFTSSFALIHFTDFTSGE